ncbi:MAG: MFS transporter [Chloroflexi bacterium]|nr:MFS transporter [Chloroflexota bacterium]
MQSRALDQMPLSRFHWRLLAVSGFGWMFDAMDILVVASVVAAVAREWGLDANQSQLINTANVAGLFFGALASGFLSDRLGRKFVFQLTLLVYSIFTGLSAAATGLAMLMALRFLAGLGLGGELPVASTLMSEFSPAKRRGTMVVLLESFWAYGSVLAALLGYLVIPNWGWRAVLLVGALPAFYVFVLRRNLPESPRYLESQGRQAEAAAIVRQVARESGLPEPPAAPQVPDAKPGPRPVLGDLFSLRLRQRTIALWVMWATINFSYYGIFLWLPSQFVRKGFSLNDALLYNLIIALAQIPGYFTAAYFVEKIGRKATLVTYLLLAAVGAFFFGQVALEGKDIASILIWGSVISFFNLGAWGVIYTYTPEMYPTALRGTGTGWAAAVGRIFAFLAPLSVAAMIALFGNDSAVFLTFAVVMVVGGLVVWAIGPETRGRSLEELTA